MWIVLRGEGGFNYGFKISNKTFFFMCVFVLFYYLRTLLP